MRGICQGAAGGEWQQCRNAAYKVKHAVEVGQVETNEQHLGSEQNTGTFAVRCTRHSVNHQRSQLFASHYPKRQKEARVQQRSQNRYRSYKLRLSRHSEAVGPPSRIVTFLSPNLRARQGDARKTRIDSVDRLSLTEIANARRVKASLLWRRVATPPRRLRPRGALQAAALRATGMKPRRPERLEWLQAERVDRHIGRRRLAMRSTH